MVRGAGVVMVLAGLAVIHDGGPAAAAGVTIGSERYAGEVMVPINKSQIIRIDEKYSDLCVGNPAIADVFGLTDRSVYVLGKKMGSTNLTIYGKNRELLAVMDIVVTHDVGGLKLRLHELVPDEKVEVRAANKKIILSGKVSTLSKLSKILAVAETYAGENVTNLMSVSGAQQVMLEVRFAEVERSSLKNMSFGLSLTQVFGDFTFGILPGVARVPGVNFDSISGSTASNNTSIDALLQGLERKGVLRTLAEPNLVALSGDTASFLAGGEIPIPVQTSDGLVVIFKEFGVRLSFTPTVVGDDLISLLVQPEVSSLDFSVVVQGIPGLRTRKAKTTVELRDGQSLAIAGLLQTDFQTSISQFPFLGDLPVLGALFRSPSFVRSESELVIIVTPRLIKPVKAGQLRIPMDGLVPPSDVDLFFRGLLEDPSSGRGRGGKLDGKFGHVIK